MDREELSRLLAAGESLERIGARFGKHPSTVGYWVKKHGLTAAHVARHAPRGGIDRARLERLVAEGRSFRDIAAELGVSAATVRHWVHKHGLQTRRMARSRERACLPEPAAPTVTFDCHVHGRTAFHLRGTRYRCGRCAADAVQRRRRRVKRILVGEAGGRCVLCGYDRYIGALEFHHVDPATKEFAMATAGVTRSLARARAEAEKCLLLCANCHAEVEGGIVRLPSERGAPSPS